MFKWLNAILNAANRIVGLLFVHRNQLERIEKLQEKMDKKLDKLLEASGSDDEFKATHVDLEEGKPTEQGQ